MQAILSVTVPFFALVLIGYLASARQWLPAVAVPGLNAYVLFFALPCLLYRFCAATPFAQLLDPSLLAVYGCSALLMVFFTIAMTVQKRRHGYGVPLRDSAFGALVTAFPNTGFMGVPLIVALMGERAAGPVIATVLTDLFLTSSICIGIAQMQAPPIEGTTIPMDTLGDALDEVEQQEAAEPRDMFGGSIVRSLRSALGNPLPWSIAAGAVVSVTGLALPAPIAFVVDMLADSATPVALFTIGAMIYRSRPSAGDRARRNGSDAMPLALFKLVLHPAIVLSFGIFAHALAIPISPFGLTVLVLAAALPSASNVSLLTERYGADSGRVARIILYSTLAASFSFSALAWLLAGHH
jgi:malonate transporter